MKFSINLRGDLAKLSDAELAERLQIAWEVHDTAAKNPNSYWFDLLHFWRSRRGPIRHPRMYRFLAILGNSDSSAAFLLSWFISSKKIMKPVIGDRTWDTHMALCEIRDILDEIKRRVAKRKASS